MVAGKGFEPFCQTVVQQLEVTCAENVLEFQLLYFTLVNIRGEMICWVMTDNNIRVRGFEPPKLRKKVQFH